MAAAIIPAAIQVAALLAPQIPAVVQLFEDLLGHSSKTGEKQGQNKLTGAVGVLTSSAQTLANAGVIPSAGVVDPSLPAVLAGAVEQAVAAMKAQGLLGADPATPTPAISDRTSSVPAIPAAGGFILTGTVNIQRG